MDNNLEKKKRLIKQKKVINLILFPCWILSFYVSISSIINVLPIIEFITIMLKMDNTDRHMLLSFLEFFYKYLPTMVYIGGKVMSFNISKEIRKMEENDEYLFIDESELKTEIPKVEGSECKIIDEDEVLKVYDIVERFENLPRSKQMEILNYIKGDLSLNDKELCDEIKELSDKYKDYLQTECEDILFPDYDEDREEMSRKRKK